MHRLTRTSHTFTCFVVGCGLALGFARGQGGLRNAAMKKEKEPKADKWDGHNQGVLEPKAVDQAEKPFPTTEFPLLWKPPVLPSEIDKTFRQLDRDRSGFLEPPEWPDRLRVVAARVDRDGDGRITPDEYRAYFEGRVAAAIEAGPGPPAPGPPAPRPLLTPPQPRTTDRFPAAVRHGHLPDGLPSWFVDLDADKDGQIALSEWRKDGRPIPEFLEMDLNGDGLLPPDEYLRYLRLLNTRSPAR